MAKEKRTVLKFKTEAEVKAFKRGLFWGKTANPDVDAITVGLLPSGKWRIEVIKFLIKF